MNIKLLVVALLFGIDGLCGQNYLEYYNAINKCKLLALSGATDESLNIYFTTFEKYDFVFARDCYNSIELAALAKDTTKLKYFIRRGITQGIHLHHMLKIPTLTDYQTAFFFAKIQEEQDSLEAIYKQSINWSLRNEIIAMFQKDQALRAEYYKALLFKRAKIRRKWEALNRIQVKRIIEITNQYGFPGERLIGIDTKNMHPKIVNSNLSAGMPIVIFIHHYSQPNPSYEHVLFEQIQKGNLYNEHFATICDFEAEFGKNKYKSQGYFAFKQLPKKINKKEINDRRERISLPTMNDLLRLKKIKGITKFWYRLY